MIRKIGEICNIFSGGDRPNIFCDCKTDDCNIPVYANAIEEEGLLGFTNKAKIPEDTITISARGSECGAVFYRSVPFYPVIRLLSLIPDTKVIYPKYLYYLLKTKKIKSFGSGQPQITIPQISEMSIEFDESLEKQKRIADFLWNIEKSIADNNLVIKKCVNICKITYSYWFNQFEFPNDSGAPYKTNKGKMCFNDVLNKDIPVDWKVQSYAINDLCCFINPGVDKFIKKQYLPTANVNGFDFDDGEEISYESRESRANMQPICNSVWFAKMKNSVKHLFIPNNAKWFADKYILSTGFTGLQCSDISFPYIASSILQPYFEKKKDILSHGATQQGVNNDDLESIILIRPTDDVLKKYKEAVGGIIEEISLFQRRNQALSRILTFICPLLLNGQAVLE